jgi:diguanylate cyclase (GGDEF)-like protein
VIEHDRIRRLAAWFGRRNVATIVALGGILVVGAAWLDGRATMDLAPLLYLAPVAFVAWYGGAGPAAGVALASGVAWGLTTGALPTWDAGIRGAAFLAFGLAVAATRRLRDHAAELARIDPLTGLPNLSAFYERAAAEIARARRYTHPFTALYIDLDGFKGVNDRLGHQAGDEVLRAVAHGIRDSLRSTDLVARVGGDEFLILLPETSAAPARLVIEKVRTALGQSALPHDATVTPCLGVATYFTPPPTVDALVQTADALMYHAKVHGAGGVEHRTFN